MFRDKEFKKCYPPRGLPHGHPPRSHHPGMFRPLMSMSRESFMEMRTYFVLKIITDNPEGITGYQLQEEYHFPRTNVLRLLDKLEEEKFVKTKEELVDGRANKLYLITDKGIKRMDELKEKWSERFRMMTDTTLPFFTHGERLIFKMKIENLDNSEDAIDFFRGLRSKIKTRQVSLEERLKIFQDIHHELDKIIESIEKDKDFDKEKLIKQVEEWWGRKHKETEEKEE